MKENSLAISVSLLFHIIIVALFLRVPFDQYIKPKLIALDFSIEKGRGADGSKPEDRNRESRIANRESKIKDRELQQKGQIADHGNRSIKQEHSFQKVVAEPSGSSDTAGSDPAGQIVIRGETGVIGAKADGVSEKSASVGGTLYNLPAVSGSMRTIDYGKGGSDAKEFSFLADTINKRFKDKYPERARRMGWEGEVLLSFVVSEDGTIRDVKVVKSSGRNVFDNHAREIIAETTFDRRLPYPRTIDNWRVTYQLH